MKKLEQKFGFKRLKLIKIMVIKSFFNLGKNDWKKLLDHKIKTDLEHAFKKEMEELNYL